MLTFPVKKWNLILTILTTEINLILYKHLQMFINQDNFVLNTGISMIIRIYASKLNVHDYSCINLFILKPKACYFL